MSDPTLNSLTYTVSALSLSTPLNNSITNIAGEITVDLEVSLNFKFVPVNISSNLGDVSVTGYYPLTSKFSNIKVTGPNSNNYKLYDANNNIVSDPSLAFKIVVPRVTSQSSESSLFPKLLIIAGIVCAISIAGFFIFRYMRSKKKNLTESGGYYYFN
jgi:hypothetical protein